MPKRATDLTGRRFGKWFVVSYSHSAGNGQYYFLCRCDCGTESAVRGSALVNGRSAGCLHCNTAKVTHGHTRGGHVSAEFRTWASMHERCHCPSNKAYPNYGGRGIVVCERWHGKEGFANFLADMGARPDGLTLERIDNDGPYSPQNCRWATYKEQCRNKRNNRNVTCGKRTMCATAWAKELGVEYRALHYFLKAGWSIRETRLGYAICSPNKRKRPRSPSTC